MSSQQRLLMVIGVVVGVVLMLYAVYRLVSMY
jgi:hypothetical protein